MSQDIGIAGPTDRRSGLSLSRGGFGWSAGGLVVAGGVEGQFAEKLAGGGVDDPDVVVLDEHQDVGSGVGSADADVVQAAVDAQGDAAGLVDLVVAESVVGVAVPAGARDGFGAGGVGGRRGGPVGQRSVRPVVVVGADEGVDEGLQLGDGGRLDRLGGELSLQGLLEPFDLAAGGGAVRAGVLLHNVAAAQLVLEVVASAAAAGEAGGVDGAVVGERGGRIAVLGGGMGEGGDHDRAVIRACAETCRA
jgi:hypothetical protein